MGCRTRVMSDVTDLNNQTTGGRGNLSFTSINLPRIAIKHGICLKEREKAEIGIDEKKIRITRKTDNIFLITIILSDKSKSPTPLSSFHFNFGFNVYDKFLL